MPASEKPGGSETYSRRERPTMDALEHWQAVTLLNTSGAHSVACVRLLRCGSIWRRATVFGIGAGALANGATLARAQTPQAPVVPAATAKVLGTVTDTSGARLSRAEVWLVSRSTLRAITDDSGHFELSDLRAGAITLGV